MVRGGRERRLPCGVPSGCPAVSCTVLRWGVLRRRQENGLFFSGVVRARACVCVSNNKATQRRREGGTTRGTYLEKRIEMCFRVSADPVFFVGFTEFHVAEAENRGPPGRERERKDGDIRRATPPTRRPPRS